MLRATSVVRKAAVKADKVIETLALSHGDRNRGKLALKGEGGLDILLDLDKPTELNDGDAVKLEDGRLVRIRAVAEDLLEVRAENPLRLMRAVWHIGSQHGLAEVTADAIYIENDPVLAELVRGQGCAATPVRRPFQPERDAGHDHADCDHPSHAHGHDHHGQAHHAHDHGHAHAHAGHDHAHAHGDACGSGHDHSHGHDHDHKHDHGHKHGAEHGKGHSHDH